MEKITEPHVNSKAEIASGKWLALHRLTFTNKYGKEQTWECASRVNCHGAAMMVATMKPSGKLILVRQFRPPLNGRIVEFPAGLIDKGEDAAATAVRELYEETGYRGTVTAVFPPTCNSPGLSGETITLVTMEVAENDHPERPETPEMEDNEDIETLLVAPDELIDFIRTEQQQGIAIDSKLLAYALARQNI